MKIARVLAVPYLIVATVMFSFQTRIIFPGQATQGQPYAEVRPRPGTELLRLQAADGVRVVALYGPALTPEGRPHPRAADRPTFVFFYGNAMCLKDSEDLFERFRRLGLNVVIPDYVGYGMSGGSPSERGCQATADAVHDELVRRRRVPADRIVVGGWSLGAAVAIDLASRRRVGGLVALSAFTSAVDMARRIAPYLPASLLVRHRFDSIGKIPAVTCPILIGHGRRDGIIPFEMGQRLARAARAEVTTLWIDEADHNDFLDVAGRRLDRALSRFVDALPRGARPD